MIYQSMRHNNNTDNNKDTICIVFYLINLSHSIHSWRVWILDSTLNFSNVYFLAATNKCCYCLFVFKLPSINLSCSRLYLKGTAQPHRYVASGQLASMYNKDDNDVICPALIGAIKLKEAQVRCQWSGLYTPTHSRQKV